MTLKLAIIATLALAGSALTAHAAPNLVQNGDFSDPGSPTSNTQMNQSTPTSNVPGWTTTSGYTFIYTPATDGNAGYSSTTAGHATAIVGPTGAPNGTHDGNGGYVPLSNNSAYVISPPSSPDAPPGSPPVTGNGGNFLGMDGAYGGNSFTLSQMITGLVTGQTYTLTFWQAASQQTHAAGNTTDQWIASLGGQDSQAGKLMTVPQGTFVDWEEMTMSFVAYTANEVLSFALQSTYPTGYQEPPFALLDSISLTENVPEPPAYALMIVALLGISGVRRLYSRRA